MSSKKRSHDGAVDLTPPLSLSHPRQDDQILDDCDKNEDAHDADGSSFSSDEEKEEFIFVRLPEIREEFQCPICLGIIRKTRTVMECLHRFCRGCIDKSMRLGNNECPSCRTHCASRRSLRDDPNFDALIAALYTDVDKYEEEEFAFHEEVKVRNRLIQDSIGEVARRLTETVGKKRTRKQSIGRNSRVHKSRKAVEQHDSDEEVTNGHEGGKDSSLADELTTEIQAKRSIRSRASQPSSGGNLYTGFDDKDSETNDSSDPGLVRGKEILKWARGRVRNKNRRAGLSWIGGRLSKGERLQKLIDHLHCSNQSNEEMRIIITMVSLHEEKIPSLQRPYICCSSKLSVRQLCRTTMDANEIEIVMVKDLHPYENSPVFIREESSAARFNPHNRAFEVLQEHLTLEDIRDMFTQQNLVLAYQQKSRDEGKETN